MIFSKVEVEVSIGTVAGDPNLSAMLITKENINPLKWKIMCVL